MSQRTIRLGSRRSRLALWQTEQVALALRDAWPGLQTEIVTYTTRGDRDRDRPLPEIGGKGLFTAEIEAALRQGEVDAAVHSLKDLPTEDSPSLVVGAVLPGADARDVLVSRSGLGLEALPPCPRIGTSSLRRAAQILAARPDAQIVPLRGNVETRLRKAETDEYDAIVLAAAGLLRLGLAEAITEWLPLEVMLPAPGQGALAVQCRADDRIMLDLLAAVHHSPTWAAVTAERSFLRRLGGGCRVPVAAYAQVEGEDLALQGLVASDDGSKLVRGSLTGPVAEAARVGVTLADQLLAESETQTLRVSETLSVSSQPLQGKRMLVTRASLQAGSLSEKLRALGAIPVEFPTIRIAPAEDTGPLDRAIAHIEDYDWVIFTSQNAIQPFWERLRAAGKGAHSLANVRIGAIGPVTAAALETIGLQADFVPRQFVAEALVAEIGDVVGKQILLPRADIAREALAAGLRDKGALVDEVVAYRTVVTEPSPDLWQTLLEEGVDIVTFTASSTVRSFVAMLDGQNPRQVLRGAMVACIGPITARTAQELGLPVDIVAEEHTIDGLVEAIVEAVRKGTTVNRVG